MLPVFSHITPIIAPDYNYFRPMDAARQDMTGQWTAGPLETADQLHTSLT